MEAFFTHTVLPLMPWAVLITLVLAFILMPLLTAILNGQFPLKSILGIVGLIAVVFIVYTLVPGDGWQMFDTAKYAADGITENISLVFTEVKLMKYVETGIGVTMLLLAAAVISWVGLEIVNFVKGLV